MLGPGMSQRPHLRLGTGLFSTSMDSTFTNSIPSPVSVAGSANPSLVSPLSEGSETSDPCFSTTQSPLVTSPQSTNPFGRYHHLPASCLAFQRQGPPSRQNSIIELGSQPAATLSPSNQSFANITYGYGNLPLRQFARTSFQTRDDQRFGGVLGEISRESGMGMSQHCTSSRSPPGTMFYSQSQMLYPSGSGFRLSSYYQSPDITQSGQQLQPHQTTVQRPRRQPSQCSLPLDPLVNGYDQRFYNHSGQYYSKMSTESCPQPTILGKEAATGPDTQPPPRDITRLRAGSDT